MIDRSIIQQYLSRSIETVPLDLPGLYRGKVRDSYRVGGYLVLIATDRISAFDHILKQTIPFKGQVLNRLAAHFFYATADIIRNHVVEIPDPNVTIARACTPFPIEFVVRGYLAGHAWRTYKAGHRMLCGIPLPEGLRQNSPFPRPILTPATKAEEGHDEDISRAQILEHGIMDASTFDVLADVSLRLFERGTAMAAEHGLVLVDTKYEFGVGDDGALYLIDEIHTPDSSRYFYAEPYRELLERNAPQKQLSKEFVREWLMEHNFQGLEGQTLPDLPDDFRVEIATRYIELFEQVTGRAFEADLHEQPLIRIAQSIQHTSRLAGS